MIKTGSGTIETLSHDGRGIARPNGKTTFVEGALPGEVVTFNYVRRKKDFDEAYCVSYEWPSSLRAEPLCPHYGVCGGCSLQHIKSNEQISVKEALLLNALSRLGKVAPNEILKPLSDSHWHYRHKARLGVRYVAKKDAVLIGFREKRNPRLITDMTSCKILPESVSELLPHLRSFIATLDAKEEIPQIEVAVGSLETALVFRNLVSLTDEDKTRFIDFGKTHHCHIFLQSGGKDTLEFLYPNEGNGLLSYSLSFLPLTYDFHPLDFTQIHPGLNEKMLQVVLSYLQLNEDDVLLDLFCGLGNFSLAASFFAKEVIGVEGSEEMTKRALTNAQKNERSNVSFYAADLDVEDALSKLPLEKVTKVLIDPPRTGALSVVKSISDTKASCLVYVSCNPATLARDANVLVHEFGWKLKAAGVMDMFPHTAHVESVAIFERI